MCISLEVVHYQKLEDCVNALSTDFSTRGVENLGGSISKIEISSLTLRFGVRAETRRLNLAEVQQEQMIRNSNLTTHLVPLGYHLVCATEYWSRTRAVCLTNQALALHDIEDGSRTPVANTQTTLQH